MAAFGLTEIQAEDILEIRLRQLARLEGIKIEHELAELREEAGSLKTLLGNEGQKKKLIAREIRADAEKFGDTRRTLVEEAGRAVLSQTAADEPVTLILSQQGWLRARAGHGLDTSQLPFKEGDALRQVLETRSVSPVLLWDTHGRAYTIDPAEVPKGRGEGIPVSTLADLPPQSQIQAMLGGAPDEYYLLSGSHGYGFAAKLGDLHSRQKAGKAVLTLDEGETALPPVHIPQAWLATAQNRLLAFGIGELKAMAKGRGLQLVKLAAGDTLALAGIVCGEEYLLHITGRRGGQHKERLRTADIAGKRAGKGRAADFSGCPHKIETVHPDSPKTE